LADVKNFKAAGMKKNEIKEINEELEKIKSKMEDCIGEEYRLSTELE
jgi:tetrahydromethanopterin S-methyltransferase subunit G